VPTYERTSGERVVLTGQSAPLAAAATQTLPVTVDLAACFGDAARRGADQGSGANAVCIVSAAVTLQSGGRTLDSAFVGPFNVRGGGTQAVSVAFVEVASVRVTRANGAEVGTQPAGLRIGETLALAAAPQGPGGAAVTRAVAWTTSAPGVATVDAATGVVTAAGVGTARIVATAGGRETAVDVVVRAPLTVAFAGAGAGAVTSAPAGVNCTAPNAAGCTAVFDPGATVTLTPAPDANSTFGGWAGDCTGTGACTVALDRARNVTATFGRRRVALSVTVAGNGAGDVLVTGGNVAPANTPCAPAAGQTTASCAYTVDAGTTVNLTARPVAGNLVGAWTGACAGSTPPACSIAPTADATVGTTFNPRPIADTVSVSATASGGAGPFGGSLAASGFVNGNPTASQFTFVLTTTSPVTGLAFDASSPVTLRFQPDASSRLVSWGGPCAGTAVDPTGISICTFNSVRNSQVTVTLAPR
jgi:hypothetical protein